MKENLIKFIERLKVNTRISHFDEASTKQAVILPILQILGWNPFDIDEVAPEYNVENRKVDYALRLNNINKYFIEVKKPGEDLENHEDQLLDYSFKQGVELATLTNGVTWWFYLPTQTVTWRDRKFYTIDISQQDTEDISERFIELLSKNNVLDGTALKNALSIFRSRQKDKIIARTIPEAWNKIISEPDELLVELVIEVVEKLCGYKPDNEKVEKFIRTNREMFIVSPRIEIKKPIKKTQSIKKPIPGKKITQDELIPHIIKVLHKFGGKATKEQVEDEIYNIFKEQFKNSWYHEKVSHGVERWRHNIAWAKQKAVQILGLIKPPIESGRGIWELTERGIDYYHKIKNKINQ